MEIMRKITLILLGVLVSMSTLSAAEMVSPSDNAKKGLTIRYRNAQPITFMERGVTFQVYPDGTLDVNYGRIGYRRAKRHRMYSGYGFPSYPQYRYHNGSRIWRNRFGQIIKIGRASVNYDYYGRVKRVGSITMSYGRFGQLRRVGGLRTWYNRWGKLVYAQGEVKPHFCGICGIDGCSMQHFDHRHNEWDRHNDWYNDRYRGFDDDDHDDDHFRKRRKRNRKLDFDTD